MILPPPPRNFAAEAFPAELRRLRLARRMSQLDLALTCDVSARHVSFLETGRTKPSRAMVLTLAQGLVLPLGARNRLLLAAGFGPVFPSSALESVALEPFRDMLTQMITRHTPNPALICDRYWALQEANAPAWAFIAALRGESTETNLVRLIAQSPNAPHLIGNLPEILDDLRARIQLESLEACDDPLLREIESIATAAAARFPFDRFAVARSPLTPLILNMPNGPMRFLSAIAHFGTSEDVTVRDLRLELFFPADASTRAAMKAAAIQE
jgi:transcriptional regulator with XRE-family HTH domain